MIDFFNNFPSIRKNDFYLSGESYAGIYVPHLASRIIDYNEFAEENERINLKGIMIGNGVTDWKIDTEPAFPEFAYGHNLISQELKNEYIKNCLTKETEKCNLIKDQIMEEMNDVSVYDIYRKCNGDQSNGKTYNYTPFLSKKLRDLPQCADAVGPIWYFNREDVKKALNVRTDINWQFCSDEVYDHYNINKAGSYFIYAKLIEHKLRILIYSGDSDSVVPTNGTEKWILNLGLPILEKWRKWSVDDGVNTAGFTIKYEGLKFVTVMGTGHLVPQWKRQEAHHILSSFLENKDI